MHILEIADKKTAYNEGRLYIIFISIALEIRSEVSNSNSLVAAADSKKALAGHI